MIKCTLCAETADTAARAPQDDGWTQIQMHLPKANRYLSVCPSHTPADIVGWVKAALAAARGKA